MTTIEEIVKRRAQMDIRLDIQCGELWGEEEIVNCRKEIQKKLSDTFAIFNRVNAGISIANPDEVAQMKIELWQQTYRTEKIFHVLSGKDERMEDIEQPVSRAFYPVVW